MWTTFKTSRNSLKGPGYTKAVTHEKGKKYTEEEIQQAECFVSLNARATNMFANRYNLAYMVNRFLQPYYKKFFAARNISIDEETYALSEMIQWIWRSRIRNGEPINLYVPSKRMRDLLIAWLNHEDVNPNL